jgi:hypothetical protein
MARFPTVPLVEKMIEPSGTSVRRLAIPGIATGAGRAGTDRRLQLTAAIASPGLA